MLRRAFLISSLLGAVSAAAALAFAPDLSRVGRIVGSLAPWRAQGFTVAPSSEAVHRRVPGFTGQPADSLQGEFCPFPDAASVRAHASDSAFVTADTSSSELTLQGQSQITKPDSAALCTGSAAPRLP